MHSLDTLSERESPEVMTETSRVIKTIMVALIALGIYDSYQEYSTFSAPTTAAPSSIVEISGR